MALPTDLNILILGGMTHLARNLLVYLILEHPEGLTTPGDATLRKVRRVRVVDKFLVGRTASTTFVDPDALKALEDERVEYRQANLTMPATAAKAFEANGEHGAFDLVFDLTGEGVLGMDVPAQLLLERTTKLAALLAAEARKVNVKAYVRDTPPFWKSKTDEGLLRESVEASKRAAPKGHRAFFWYEAERAVANAEGLPLSIMRSAGTWGPGLYSGDIQPRMALGQTYKILGEPIKTLWSGDLRMNTLHAQDWCSAAWALAIWTGSRTRAQADAEAGEVLPPVQSKESKGFPADFEKQAATYCERSKSVKACVWNVVDENDTNQAKLLGVISEVFGVECGYVNAAINAWARLNLSSVVDEMNEKHVEAYADILSKVTPPITYTPFSPFLDQEAVAQRAIALDGDKLQRIVGWKAQRKLDADGVREMVRKFQEAGVWGKFD